MTGNSGGGAPPDGGSSSFDEDGDFEVPRSNRDGPKAEVRSTRALDVAVGEWSARSGPRDDTPPGDGGARPTPAWSDDDEDGGSKKEDDLSRGHKDLYKNDVRCVFIGPPQAGKTTVVGGILQACMQPPTSAEEYRLKLIAESASTSNLVRETYARMRPGQGKLKATEETIRYQFNVRVTQPGTLWRPPVHEEALLMVRDGPGGALFPGETEIDYHDSGLKQWESLLLDEARAADCLVLCVDATQRDSGLLLSQLPGRLGDLSDSTVGTLVPVLQTWRHRAYARIRRLWREPQRRREVWERWIAASRVLILLNKIDALAETAARRSGHRVSASALAAAIDPVHQACELLGEVFLYQILRALNPRTQRMSEGVRGGLAVGVSSAWGFDRYSGDPFRVDSGGRERIGTYSPDTTRLKDWRPMGLRDALIFIVSGHAVGSVRMVDEEMLMKRVGTAPMRAGNRWLNEHLRGERRQRSWT